VKYCAACKLFSCADHLREHTENRFTAHHATINPKDMAQECDTHSAAYSSYCQKCSRLIWYVDEPIRCFVLFVTFLYFCISVFLYFCISVFLYFCIYVFMYSSFTFSQTCSLSDHKGHAALSIKDAAEKQKEKIGSMCESLASQSQYIVKTMSTNRIQVNDKRREIEKLQREIDSMILSFVLGVFALFCFNILLLLLLLLLYLSHIDFINLTLQSAIRRLRS
jgi:Ca2+/Na+ antiporter